MAVSRPDTAVVFDIQRFSIHDGPGIRTVIFFKGCALACSWCQNPEAVRAAPEIAYFEERCLADCSRCVFVCPEEAVLSERIARVDFARCTACGECVDVCPTGALREVGREVEAAELLAEVQKDVTFYAASGGGITLSGGEPVLHASFLRDFLPLVADAGLHVTLETGGSYPFAMLEPLLGWIDLVLFDLKLMDPVQHRHFTSRENQPILENLQRLLARDTAVDVRMPVVPELNTGSENTAATAAFLTENGVSELTLLPYNHPWEAKVPRLGIGIDHPPLGIRPPDEDFYASLRSEFERRGLATRM
jgi:pyruvate formate lyase activating enzyme